MNAQEIAGLSIVGAVAIVLLAREIARRFLIHYEYRWDSFSVRGPFGRQLFQIRQSEIESLQQASLADRLTGRIGARFWPRTHFGQRVVIRARMARRPVVISWEGQAIAGLKPKGLKLRPVKAPKPSKRR